jgi:hypothetical protein
VSRSDPADALNVLQVQHYDRNNMYNQEVTSQPEAGAIALYGPRKQAPIVLEMIQDPAVARKILAIESRRRVYLRNTYKFTLKSNWNGIEPMDLVTITEPKIFINALPVRLTKVIENENAELECEAEPFVYGCHSPDALAITAVAPYVPSTEAVVATLVNTPVIFEPYPKLISSAPNSGGASTPQQLWIVVSDSDVNYGGSIVMLSTDGGGSYNPVGQITGNAITGYTVGDWPAHADPDTADDLAVDLTESLGTLASYAVADEDAFTYPCYVAGNPGGTFGALFPYELMTYAVATLTAANKYTLKATGGGTNHLRRNVFAVVEPGQGWDHPNNSRWAFLSPAGTGILKLNLDPKWIGTTLHFKFLAVNQIGGNPQDLTAVTDYTYTPQGVVTATNPSTQPSGSPDPNSTNYAISGGALTNPTATTIHMAQATGTFKGGTANYNARTFTIPAPTSPTTYYVTIFDPGLTGDNGAGTTLAAYCETSPAKKGVPGYVYMGSIVALPGGGGTMTNPGGNPTGAQITVNGV